MATTETFLQNSLRREAARSAALFIRVKELAALLREVRPFCPVETQDHIDATLFLGEG